MIAWRWISTTYSIYCNRGRNSCSWRTSVRWLYHSIVSREQVFYRCIDDYFLLCPTDILIASSYQIRYTFFPTRNYTCWNHIVRCSSRPCSICFLLILILKRTTIACSYPSMRNSQVSYTCTRVTVGRISYIYRSELIAALHLKVVGNTIITAIVIYYSDLVLTYWESVSVHSLCIRGNSLYIACFLYLDGIFEYRRVRLLTTCDIKEPIK